MEITITIITVTLLFALLFSPVLIVKRLNRLNISYKFIVYLTISILVSAAIALSLGWWVYTSDKILLKHYGYNFDAMNDTERFGNVSAYDMERVKSLETGIMGIGWPLKVFMFYIFYSPYLLIVYLVAYLFGKNQVRRN